jgi:hypothetical protein
MAPTLVSCPRCAHTEADFIREVKKDGHTVRYYLCWECDTEWADVGSATLHVLRGYSSSEGESGSSDSHDA